jgi:hypothetical protein
MLSMIIDCSLKEIAQIEAFLEKKYRKGELIYGMHSNDSALITYSLSSADTSRKMNFIDGADGGYALAARQLKQQLFRSRYE